MNDSHIIVQNASLRFRSYRNPSPNLKETFVDKLTKKNYNSMQEFDALKNINLEIRPGDRLGICGLNGAGKSTLLKMIVGIYPPQAGHVSVRGKITPMIELGTGFDAELSGRENIYLNGTLIGRSYKQMKRLEEEIIEFSELGDKIDMPIKYYSSGMHARLAFSIGAIADPEILIMDEIFAAGDAQFVQKSLNRLHEMFDKAHILILVSHSEKHILNICNRAIVLNKGELVLEGSTVDCVDHYMTEIVKDPSWEGAQQWVIDPLSFKDRKIMERLSAAHSLELQAQQALETEIEQKAEEASFEPDTEIEIAAEPKTVTFRKEIFEADSGISLGEGWHWIERFETEEFRWVDNDAEIHLPTWSQSDNARILQIVGEAGPSLGRPRCAIKLLDGSGTIVDEIVLGAKKTVSFMLPDYLAGTTVRLHVDSNSTVPDRDDRVLNFRLFDISIRFEDVSPTDSALEIADETVIAPAPLVEPVAC
ncbi:MAG TPA: ABC transporter ATP-binding protein [Oculatellaceae cyanobacterium]